MTNVSRTLGAAIGTMSREQSDIKSNISPNEQSANAFIINQEQISLSGSVVVSKRTLSNVLTVAHPVYGVVGTVAGNDGLSFPLTFPLTFTGGSGGVSGYPVYVPIILGHAVWGLLGVGYLSGEVAYSTEIMYEASF